MSSRRGSSLRLCLLPVASSFLLSPKAEAHLVNSGFGAFYDGMVHFMLSPADVLVVLALGLLAGFSGKAQARALLLSAPAAWLAGTGAGMILAQPPPVLGTVLTFGLLGLLLAVGTHPAPRLYWSLGALCGAIHGWENGSGLLSSSQPFLTLAGIAATLFVLCSLLSAAVTTLRAAWLQIAVRVAGSWMVAISMLMLAWYLRRDAGFGLQ